MLRLVPAVLRKFLSFSDPVRMLWAERRMMAKRYDSYQWQKLFWVSIGLVAYIRWSGQSRTSWMILALTCLSAGAIGMARWRVVVSRTGTKREADQSKIDRRSVTFMVKGNGAGWTQRERSKSPGLRVCMPTARGFTKRLFQCGQYEAQDVLTEIADVDLIALETGSGFHTKEKWQRRLLYHDLSNRLIFQNPGLRRVRLNTDYDLFVVHCQTYWDLLYVNAVEGWKDRCKTSVCWIDELWVSALPHYRHWLHALTQFDHVFVGFKGTAGPLSKAINQRCHWLPGAVDTLRFTPYPNPPARVIDVYSIGRRWEGIHQSLLSASAHGDIFYVYDTFPSVFTEVYDHRQHRDHFASLAQRSKYFMVAPGKIDVPEETQGQVAIGFRYYEGAAGGAVMIGQPPNCEEFANMFSWPDAVIPVQTDGADILDVLASFESQPQRLSAISRRNASEALLRHDWLYRWKELFRIAGIEPTPAMQAREDRLKATADTALHGTEVEALEKAQR
jgi:hypothetical protein